MGLGNNDKKYCLKGFLYKTVSKSALSLCLITTLSFTFPAYAQSTFEGLGDLPGGFVYSQAYEVSVDGTIVIGYGYSASGTEAFRWTQAGGMVGLGDLDGGSFNSRAFSVNADGSVIVGRGRSASGTEAFRWTQAGGMVGLGDLDGGSFNSVAYDVNADGTVIVGGGESTLGSEAFRWTESTGMVGLGDLAGGGFYSQANGVSADGTAIVGFGNSASGYEAFRWTESTGMVGLGDLDGGAYYSYAVNVNNDGTVIVGLGNSASGSEAFRWTESTGMVGLGDLDGGSFDSIARDVSGDGSVVVGYGSSASGYEAFRWTQEDGMITVEDWLDDAGVSIGDFTSLRVARGINDDGTVIVGYGENSSGDTEAFLARVSSLGSGILDPVSSTQSIQDTDGIESLTSSGLNLPLFGAHHHPLMMMYAPEQCVWASVDAAQFEVGEDGYLFNQEVGGCRAFMDGKLYAGVGIGLNKSMREGYLDGEQELDGQYGILELNYRPSTNSPIFGLITLAGHWDAEVERAYLNAGSRDTSNGETDVVSGAVKASVNWPDMAKVKITKDKAISISPKASYTATKTHINGYTETGGGFPARFDDREVTKQQVRIGFDLSTTFNDDKSIARLIIEGAHVLDRSGDDINGQLLGLNTFSNAVAETKDTWGRTGVELEHRFDNNIRLLGTTFIATRGGGDPELTGALNISVPF